MADGDQNQNNNGGDVQNNGTGGDGAPFYGTFADPDLKSWAENKAYKTPEELAKAHRGLEVIFGADKAGRTAVVPSNWEDEGARNEFFDRIGRPKTAGDYGFKVEGGDETFLKGVKETFHKLGVTDRQAADLVKWHTETGAAIEAGKKAESEARNTEQLDKLKTEWGGAYDANLKIVDMAAARLGMDEATLTALRGTMGAGAALKFVHGLATKLGEDKIIEGDRPGGEHALTPAQAQAKIGELTADNDFNAAYLRGEKWALEKMSNLQQQAVAKAS
jgi:hypothetical protein